MLRAAEAAAAVAAWHRRRRCIVWIASITDTLRVSEAGRRIENYHGI